MQTSLDLRSITSYVRKQINVYFPDPFRVKDSELHPSVDDAIQRLDHCFSHITVPRYCGAGASKFNHLYSDQYLMFLWFLANSLWKREVNENLVNKAYLLNKALHAFDCAFDTLLPDIFIVVHGVGTVLGKARYSDYFTVYHGCTVGQAQGIYPTLGPGCGVGAGAAVLGNCIIGRFGSVAAGCTLINTSVPADHLALRAPDGPLTVRPTHAPPISAQYFDLTRVRL